MGVKLFMCFPFSGEKGKHINKNSQEISGKGRDSPGIIPGQSRENFVYVFSCLWVFPGPKSLEPKKEQYSALIEANSLEKSASIRVE